MAKLGRPLGYGQRRTSLGKRRKTVSTIDKISLALATVAVVVLVSLSAVFLPDVLSGEDIDPETFCPTEGIKGHTLLVLDRTDALEASHRRVFSTLISDIKDQLSTGAKFSAFEVDPGEVNGLSTEPLFALCRPRDGSDANKLYQNPDLLARRFEKRFGEPLEEFGRTAPQGGGADRSPIMESLMDASLLGDFRSDTPDRRLIIFSDMLQHTDGWSHYRNGMSFEAFKQNAYAKQVIPDLSGIVVNIHYVLRPIHGAGNLQTDDHILFWDQYFSSANVHNLFIVKVR